MKRGLLLLSLFVAGHCLGADTATPRPAVKLKTPAPTPTLQTEAIKSFQVQRGFRVELVAAEPLTSDPVGMAFDENGRLFVLEVPDRTATGANIGRVRVLEDADNDGSFDGSSLYANNIQNPTALICYDGGVFVAADGQILYLKDSSGDGVADQRREVFKIFGDSTNNAGGPVIITGLAWGLDNRIHAVTSSRGGDIISSSAPSQSVVLHEGAFSFDPRTFIVKEEGGSAASGLCFDDHGRKFICTSNVPLKVVMYGPREETQNPFYTLPKPVWGLSGTAASASIYLPAAPGRAEPPPVLFSAATSLLMYDGNAFPRDYYGDAFVVDSAASIVHREKVRSETLVPSVERSGEGLAEFFAVRDQSFQPTQIINAPDGTLYFTGVTRDMHVAAKTNNTSTNAHARGRIFRIAPLNFRRPKLPDITKLPPAQLVAMLRHPNGWQRETASRLLYERQDRATVVPLIQMLFDPVAPPLARMRALRALDGIDLIVNGRTTHALLESHLLHALSDPDDHVRVQAVSIAEKFLSKSGIWSDTLWGRLSKMGTDPSPRVRWQLALTLGESHNEGRAQTLADIIRTDAKTYLAVLSALGEGAAEVFATVAPDARLQNDTNGVAFLRGAVTIIGKKVEPAEVLQTVRVLQNLADPKLVFAAANWLDQGLAQSDNTLLSVVGAETLKPLIARATAVAQDLGAEDAARIDAMRFLAVSGPSDWQLAYAIAKQRTAMKPELRAAFYRVFFLRPEWTDGLLTAIDYDFVPRLDLNLFQVQLLLSFSDPDSHAYMLALFGAWDGLQRQPVVNREQGVLGMSGDIARGYKLFLKNCAVCHAATDESDLPYYSLTTVKSMEKPKLLAAILNPKQSTGAGHPTIRFTLNSGETPTGFVVAQTEKSILISDIEGTPYYIARSSILSQKRLDISGMPEDWEKTLNQQELADLLEYLSQ